MKQTVHKRFKYFTNGKNNSSGRKVREIIFQLRAHRTKEDFIMNNKNNDDGLLKPLVLLAKKPKFRLLNDMFEV